MRAWHRHTRSGAEHHGAVTADRHERTATPLDARFADCDANGTPTSPAIPRLLIWLVSSRHFDPDDSGSARQLGTLGTSAAIGAKPRPPRGMVARRQMEIISIPIDIDATRPESGTLLERGQTMAGRIVTREKHQLRLLASSEKRNGTRTAGRRSWSGARGWHTQCYPLCADIVDQGGYHNRTVGASVARQNGAMEKVTDHPVSRDAMFVVALVLGTFVCASGAHVGAALAYEPQPPIAPKSTEQCKALRERHLAHRSQVQFQASARLHQNPPCRTNRAASFRACGGYAGLVVAARRSIDAKEERAWRRGAMLSRQCTESVRALRAGTQKLHQEAERRLQAAVGNHGPVAKEVITAKDHRDRSVQLSKQASHINSSSRHDEYN